MTQRRNPFHRSQLDASVFMSADQPHEQHTRFRIRFLFGLITFLVGLTGFLIVLAIAINGS